MVSPARWLAWLVCLSLLFVGCRDAPATQLLVVLDSDIPIGSALQRVQIVVTDRSGRDVVSQQEFAVFRTQRAAGVTLPVSLGVVPVGGDATRRIRVIARSSLIGPQGARDLVELTAITGFIEGKKLLLPMFLQRSCINTECSDGFTCLDGQCVSALRLPETLQELAQPGSFDASGLFDVNRSLPDTTDASAEDTQPPADVLMSRDAPEDVGVVDVPNRDVTPADVTPADVAPADVAPADVAPADVAPADAPMDAAATMDAPMDAADDRATDAPEDVAVARTDVAADASAAPDASDASDAADVVDATMVMVDPCVVDPVSCNPWPPARPLAPLSGTWAASTHVTFRVRLPSLPTGVASQVRIEQCAGGHCTSSSSTGTLVTCLSQVCSGTLEVSAAPVMFWRAWLESPPRRPSPSGEWMFHPRQNMRPARDAVGDGLRTGAWGTTGDLDGDGISEVAVGAPRDLRGGRVFLGRGTRSITPTLAVWQTLLPTLSATRDRDRTGLDWGHTVAIAGDMNGDGVEEIAVSSLESATVAVFQGGALSRSVEVSAIAAPSDLGTHLAAVGDINQDGYADLAVSYPSLGRVRVIQGSAAGPGGAVDLLPEPPIVDPAMTVASAGDLNGDLRGDVIAGFPATGRAVVWLSNFMSDTDYFPVELASGSPGFGRGVGGGSDVNGDGFSDALVISASSVFVHFGAATNGFIGGRVLSASLPACWDPTRAGAVAGLGDLENDGLDEIAVSQRGCVAVYHQTDVGGSTLLAPSRLIGLGDTLGASIAAAGDLNGDGLRDVIVGDPDGVTPAANVLLGNLSAYRASMFTPPMVVTISQARTGFGDSVAGLFSPRRHQS